MRERRVAAQEVQVRLAPGGDMVVVIAVGDGATDHQQQNLAQRVEDATNIAWVLDPGKMIQQDSQA